MKKVFIIGNGPSARHNQIGAHIDRASFVVRINNFQTAGHKKYVGTKTDLLFTCRLNEYMTDLDRFPEVILCLLMNPLDGVTIPQELINSPNVSRRIDWDQVNELTPRLGLRENCYPSTGLLCILTMLERFDHVHIVGFDNFVNGNRHYFQDGPRLDPPRHDGDGERRLIELLAKSGQLTVGK